MSTRCHLIYHPTDEMFEVWWDTNDDSVHIEAAVKELNVYALFDKDDEPAHHVVRMKLPPDASKLMLSVLTAHEKIKRLKIDLSKEKPSMHRAAHALSWNYAIDAALALLTEQPRRQHKTGGG